MRVVLGATLVILFMGIFNLFGGSFEERDPDQVVLQQLQKAGSDLAKPHHVDFFLYLPSEAAANTAASRMRERGFDAAAKPPLGSPMWRCEATKNMVPDLSELQRIRRDLVRLTAELGGKYDGWGTGVEK